MKTVIYSIAMVLLFFSCSSNENNSTDTIETPSNLRFVKTITAVDPPSYDVGDSLNYTDGKLKFAFFSNELKTLNYFEYNNNKVSKRYWSNQFEYAGGPPNWDVDNFDLNAFIAASTELTYIYSGDRLMEERIGGTPYVKYNYNEAADLIAVERYEIGELAVIITISYENNQIEQIIVDDILGNHYRVYNLEFDNKNNPVYALSQKYGFMRLTMARRPHDMVYTYGSGEHSLNGIFKNNITKMYIDGELKYSAFHEYDDYDYPTKITWTYANVGSGIELLTYHE